MIEQPFLAPQTAAAKEIAGPSVAGINVILPTIIAALQQHDGLKSAAFTRSQVNDQMSKPDTISSKCPTCQNAFSMTVWSSVNVTLDPDLRKQVLSGEIRDHVCSRCDQKLTINRDLIYHDMNRKFMISYLATDDGRTRSMSTDFLSSSRSLFQNYRLRFVTSWNQLREKIAIFEADLDDTHIELIKFFIADKAYGHATFGDDNIYFLEKRQKSVGDEGDIGFEAYQEGNLLGVYRYPLREYEKIAEEMEQQFGQNYETGVWKMVNQATNS